MDASTIGTTTVPASILAKRISCTLNREPSFNVEVKISMLIAEGIF
jgi:hypothetical protein